MLDRCAPEALMEPYGDHRVRVRWKGRVYWSLPSGDKSKRRSEIQKGHVKGLVRDLGIDPDCAASRLKFLR